MQLTLLNIWRLGAMDSLHVTSQQTTGSKTSSRSTSPCRPREHHTHHAPHHTKTLSHGSDSGKSQDGGVTHSSHRPSRHRSPTTSTNRTDMEDGSHVYLDDSGPAEADNSDICYTSFFSNGSSEHVKQDDETDNIDPKISATLEQLSNKIIRVRDLIKTEQKMRDDNVNEYLKLAANADKQQVQRIKAVFEKKNQKSAQVISQLQKKLDTYQKRVHELETHGLVQSHRPPREVLRDMGQGLKNVGGNIRDGITGFSGSVMSKPREFAHLIKNKFGSADNISQLSSGVLVPFSFHNLYLSSRPGATGSEGSAANGGTGSDQGEKVHHGSATLPATLHTATSQTSMGQAHRAKFPSDEGSECSSVTSDSIGRFGRGQETGSNQDSLKALYKQLTTKQEEIEALKEKLEQMKSLPQEIQYLHAALQEERFRTERLEEQINDLTELHQNEVENLKQAMADMEEKVQYQSEERLRDIHEILEHCQTKIQKMEHQALQQQQYVTLEGLDNSNARALVVKLINILLTVLQVVLLLVATGAGIIMPFLRTRVRILTTVFIVLATVFILRQWPEVQDIGSHVMKRLKDMLDPVK
ncbi:transmembrane and coiled-coil domains protein 2 isoform X1 [Tribolium castaneum]|uniref:transmembrane and coiled-coil domains protein 2 isoform X1 n=3 Tax=Tribolium castaneum TaxID=7070 RepID=UPI00077DCDA9|nr:PREDICTED: transmembrane and coiled-coil domains protein 2 isoform X1 [Tribolium castaneum]|eukprot:XP_015833371.1 PREDICTED: transmembrane and coiled-coil domains protein 2 isoform X1 [Tribolium castaneum]